MIAAMFTGDVLVMVIVTGLVLVLVLAVVARRIRRDRQSSAAGWADYQARLCDLYDAEEYREPVPAAVSGAGAAPAIGGRQAAVTVTSVRDLPAAPAGALTAGPARAAVPPVPAPAPVPAAGTPALQLPGPGDRVRAGGKWGHVQAITRPAGAGVARFHLRMDDGTSGHVDVPDAEVLAEPADPYAAAREEARAAAERARATTRTPIAPPPVRPPVRPAPARAVAPRASTVSVGGFTIPCAGSGAGGRS